MAALQRPGGAGLVLAEYASAQRTRRGSITKAGSASAKSHAAIEETRRSASRCLQIP